MTAELKGMSDLRLTEEHEWLRLQEDGSVRVGITDYAQEQLGDVVYVELPEPGSRVSSGDEAAVVESVKAAGEVKAPVTGEITSVNERLGDEPELVNSSPLDDGWFFTMTIDDAAELDALMDEDAYAEFVKSL